MWPHWGVENEIIVFPINEGSNRQCCRDNKMFYVLEPFLSYFIINTKFYLILTGNVKITFDSNVELVEVLLVTSQFLLKGHKLLNFFRIFAQDFRGFGGSYLWNGNRYQQTVNF